MQYNSYTTDQLVKFRIEERMAEAEHHRLVQLALESSKSERPVRFISFQSFSWSRRLAIRFSRAGA
jgi:hypothetical protein